MFERHFYPMINNTMANILRMVEPCDMWEIVGIICTFPKHKLDGELAAKPIVDVLLAELHRQYGRWNKRGE
jgi:hypothetical protein